MVIAYFQRKVQKERQKFKPGTENYQLKLQTTQRASTDRDWQWGCLDTAVWADPELGTCVVRRQNTELCVKYGVRSSRL